MIINASTFSKKQKIIYQPMLVTAIAPAAKTIAMDETQKDNN
jgi:hypothetical protein